MSNRDSFLAQLRCSPAGSPVLFMPILEEVVARVAASSREAIRQDPILGATAIAQAAELLDADLIALGFDITLTLEVCGAAIAWDEDRPMATGSMAEVGPELSETCLARFSSLLDGVMQAPGRRKPVAVALCGPATLVRSLWGEAPDKEKLTVIKPLLTRLAEAICSRRPALLVLQEQAGALGLPAGGELRRAYSTLRNVAAYYGTDIALYLEGEADAREYAAQLSGLKLDALLLERLSERNRDSLAALLKAAEAWPALGLPVPVPDPEAASEMVSLVRELAAPRFGSGIFFLSDGAIPRAAELENVRKLKDSLQGAAGLSGSQEER